MDPSYVYGTIYIPEMWTPHKSGYFWLTQWRCSTVFGLSSTYQVAEDHDQHTICEVYSRFFNLKDPHNSNSIGHKDAQAGSNNGKNGCWLPYRWWESYIWSRSWWRCHRDDLTKGGASHSNNDETCDLCQYTMNCWLHIRSQYTVISIFFICVRIETVIELIINLFIRIWTYYWLHCMCLVILSMLE